jgi:hypothetical protein
LGYSVGVSHMSSMTRPASFIPPRGISRPNWLKVTLPYLDTHLADWPTVPGCSRAVLATPRLLTKIRPASVSKS